MSYIIGIGLGTSTIEAVVYQDGKPVMLFNTDGKIVTLSVIGLDENDQFIIGERVRAHFLLYPEKNAIEEKRKIGSNEMITLGANRYTPVQLYARLLEYVRKYASDALHEDITHAVISVSAYFDDLQRRETIAAGQKAGFTVERILNEPTAAAMSYGLAHIDEKSHILVYDLGGGTFDITLREMFEGILEIKASSGDNELGGKDFDQCLIDYLVLKFMSENGIDLKMSLGAMVRLKDAAEALQNCPEFK